MAKPDVMDVLGKIRKDPNLTKQFAADPQQTLKQMGVDTTGLNVQKVAPKPGVTAAAEATFCGSVGCVACGSVG